MPLFLGDGLAVWPAPVAQPVGWRALRLWDKGFPLRAPRLPHLRMSPPIVVIGASLGGVSALIELVRALPANFPAIVAVVLHIGNRPSILPELLGRASPLK